MRVLLTGATGFVGRAFVRRLLREPGISVFGVTRGEGLGVEPGCTPVGADLSQPGWTGALPEGIDSVVHLAQSRRYREFPEGARDMVAINVDATFELVHWASGHRVKRFVFASTGNVYRAGQALLDEDAPCEPVSMYAATKLSGEHIARQYDKLLDVVVVRPFGVYGPGQRGMLVPNTIDRVAKDEEIILARGAGLYLTPLHVADCAEMLFRVATQVSRSHAVYNLSGNEVLNLGQIVTRIGLALGRQPRVCNTEAEPQYLLGKNARFAGDFGYRPRIAFDDAIAEIIERHGNV